VGFVAIVLALSAVVDLSAYEHHVHSEAAYYNFETGATELAAAINRFLQAGWPGQG